MIRPNLTRWTAGTQVGAPEFNQVLDALRFFRDPPQVHVVRGLTTQQINNVTWTPVTFDTAVRDREAEYDPDAPMWSAATPDTLTIRTSGWYHFELNTTWAQQLGDNSRRLQAIVLNGAAVGPTTLRGRIDTRNADTHRSRSVFDTFLNASDTVKMYVYQDSGGARFLNPGASVGAHTGLRLKWTSL